MTRAEAKRREEWRKSLEADKANFKEQLRTGGFRVNTTRLLGYIEKCDRELTLLRFQDALFPRIDDEDEVFALAWDLYQLCLVDGKLSKIRIEQVIETLELTKDIELILNTQGLEDYLLDLFEALDI